MVHEKIIFRTVLRFVVFCDFASFTALKVIAQACERTVRLRAIHGGRGLFDGRMMTFLMLIGYTAIRS
jgi:hypothetical protein